MKSKILILPLLLIVLMFGCENPSTQYSNPTPAQTFGSLTIGDSSESRVLDVSKILGAKVSVTGTGISNPLEEETTIKDGKVSGVIINYIPTGKNRIVTVKAATKGSEIAEADFIDSVVMRAVTDINAGANSVSVNWASTALGNVFHELLQLGYNISNITDKSSLENAIDTNVHATLINAKAIAEDFKAGELKGKENYVLNGATVTFTVIGDKYQDYGVIVTDPASKETKVSAGTVTGITAGKWDFVIVNKDTDMEWYRQTISVENDKTLELGTIAFKSPSPKILPENIFFKDSLEITIKMEAGSTVYYTKDGSAPTVESEKYTAPFTITVDTTVKAFAVMEGLEASDVVTQEYKIAKLGYTYPADGTYSAVEIESWGTSTFSLGANIDSDGNGTFAVYSKNATKMLLEIYDKPYGEDAAYDYWMEKGSDDIWRAKVKGIPNGTLYAFRAWGPNWEYAEKWDRGNSKEGFGQDYDSVKGNRFNPNKVLFDPYAKEISHDKSHPDVLAMVIGGTGSDGKENPAVIYSSGDANKVNGAPSRNFDTGKYAPKAVVVVDKTDFGTKPKIPQEKAIIYEAHARGITKHPSSANLTTILKDMAGFEAVKDIPTEYQGTYKGAAMLAPYLKALGVNTIELLPVHESDNDCNPDDNPGGNYWAYMTYGYFAPDRRYSYDKSLGGPTKEFKEMVKAFHDIGMEVYLDVVFNHSGEGGTWYGKDDAFETAEITFMRGLDNSTYYSLVPGTIGAYWENTGCGNNLQCDNGTVRNLILDSLTYWIDEMGVDGYRFDLAPVLGREGKGSWKFNKSAETITKIVELGNLRNVEMIAEAWDCNGDDSYQVGTFPNGWGEWNGRYRDSLRGYIGTGNRNGTDKGDFLQYMNGDYANFNDQGGPHKSVNFVVAHDGFTLADLCSYGGAGNAQNGVLTWPFGPSDGGNGDYNSLGFGTEQKNKRQAARNYIAIQMMSRGVPMIVWGDEFSRTQNGNNNPYNIDSVATWSNYNMINTSSPHFVPTGGDGAYHNNFGTFASKGVNGNFMFMKYMLNLKANEPALNQANYNVDYDFKKEDGTSTLSDSDRCVWLHIDGSSVTGGSDYLVFMNMYTEEVPFTVPAAATGKTWIRIADTQNYFESECNFWNPATIEAVEIPESYGVAGWSVVILKEVAKREHVKNPTFTPEAETFNGSVEVTISSATTGAEVYYTLDGSVPSETNGTKFTSAIKLESTTTIKAIAVKDGAYSSEIVSKKYTNTACVETPVLSVPAGDFWDKMTVFVTCDTKEANIYYTTDGSEPTAASTAYNASKGIVISDNATLKVIACKSGVSDSVVASASYTKQTAQDVAAEKKSGVMLQGFNWDSAPRGEDFNAEHPNPAWGKWYGIMKKNAGAMQKFEYVWFPPPSKTDTGSSEGYAPNELNNLNSCYGTEAELKEVIAAIKPAKAIADIVINHRSGTTSWGDFTNPKWTDDYYSICSDDDGFTNSDSPMHNSTKKGAADTGIGYDAYRDLDHTNVAVQQGIYSWMNTVLKRAGFVGWRYDYVKGFGGKYVGYYNAMSDAAFSVGEYWPDDGIWADKIGDWIASTAETVNGVAGKQSRAFDFVLKQKMNYAFGWTKSGSDVYEDGVTPSGDYWNMALLAETSSLMRSNPSAAVTFVDNHDTGSTQQHWELSWFDVPAAYAFILTHPGMPCVASQHYFAEGDDFSGGQYRGGETVPGTEKTMRQHIDYLIGLRQRLEIEYDDTVEVLKTTATIYVAKIAGTKGEIIVKIGGDSYTPTGDGYTGNYPIYSGTNFAIWEKGEKGVEPAEPIEPAPEGRTLKFTRPDNWGNTMYAHLWSESKDYTTWPGNQMTWIGQNEFGNHQFEIIIPEGATHVIFTDNGGHQTVNIIISPTAIGYYTNGGMDGAGNFTVESW